MGLKFEDLTPPFDRLTGEPDGFPSERPLQLRPAPVAPVITMGRDARLGIRENRRFPIAITGGDFVLVFYLSKWLTSLSFGFPSGIAGALTRSSR